MGRRKERRIAAAAGRRVKLDLFAEPSGGLGAQNEVGGDDDDDTKNHVGLSDSPSSSGKQPEDPLALLGQYSDDESDGHSSGSSGEQRRAAVQDFMDTLDKPAQLSTEHGSGSSAVKELNGYTSQKGGQLAMETSPASMEIVQKMEDGHPTEDSITNPVVMMEENDLSKEVPTSDAQEADSVILGWKIVLHEETNQHYYWNVTTGETSWEMPEVLIQKTNSIWEKKDPAINESMETANVEEKPEHSESEYLEHKNGSGNLVQSCLNGSFPPTQEQNHAASSPVSNVFSRETHDEALGESLGLVHGQGYEGGKHLLSILLKQYEHLLEKVNFVEGEKCNLHGHDQMLKCLLELEIRLADMKSLASYGSSLTPYWEHCNGRFLQLEKAVNDVHQCLKCEELNEIYVGQGKGENSCDDKVENLCQKKPVCASGDPNVCESVEEKEVSKNSPELCTDGPTATGLVPSDHDPSSYCGNANKEIKLNQNESERIAKHPESIPKKVLHSEEDVDMDVDMEVEDIAPSSMCSVGDPPIGVPRQVPSEHLNQPNQAANHEPSTHEEIVSIPPAPDDYWIPPPPPDDESVPPPPPDEPFESMSMQPSDLASVQSFPYPEHFSYSNSHFQYYGQADAELHNSSVFVNAEAYQPTISHPRLYCEASAESYGPTLAVNPVLPSLYFGVQEGMLLPALESSGVCSDSIYKDSVATGSLNEHAVGFASSLPKHEVNASTTVSEASRVPLEIPYSEIPIQESATILATETVSVPSVPTVTESVAVSAPAKGQSKVMRPKKRTVAAVSSLKSNKKVSSLVDKWKAAKEELEEEEKEPKNAYEKLEMKRQRLIEEWRAQQIASGEAKDNANFQPLGGDWRERVKRKRAQSAKESTTSPSYGEEKKQPDLNESSKGLPSGWQVYWDDSSKQVYYANSVTLETTWIRPTN